MQTHAAQRNEKNQKLKHGIRGLVEAIADDLV